MRPSTLRRMSYLLLAVLLSCAAGTELQAQKRRARANRARRARTAKRAEAGAEMPPPVSSREVLPAGVSGDVPDAGNAVVTPAPSPTPPVPKRSVVSGGILNGKAVSKPQPVYPPEARAARAHGQVAVKILIDEEGNVISADAVSGHRLLRAAAEAAAREAKFAPTRLSGQPVKVSGVLIYDFVL